MADHRQLQELRQMAAESVAEGLRLLSPGYDEVSGILDDLQAVASGPDATRKQKLTHALGVLAINMIRQHVLDWKLRRVGERN